MIDVEAALVELSDRVVIVPVPPVADRLAAQLARSPLPRRPVTHRRGLVVACAAGLAAVATTLAIPAPRHTIARWLGFDSVRIEPGVTVPSTAEPATSVVTTPVSGSVTPPSSAVPVPDLDLGPVVPIDAAVSATGLTDPRPALLGEPISVHVVHPPSGGQIVAVYGPSDLLPVSSVTGVGALVSVFPAHIDEGMFAKTLGEATVRSVDVNGLSGYWIEGAPHQLLFESEGVIEPQTFRLATNTLLWQSGEEVYRIEADVALDLALRIAASI